MPIRVLPPAVAAQVRAGEVVERPALVVKELLDNSLDAGADTITVEIRQGGLELIRVTDNGLGIPAAEAELAFARHATSKISTAADLGRIRTLGFRGEALPSIAAVAQVSLLTRPPDQPAALFLALEGGVVRHREFRPGPPGTTVTVRHLFYNTPARRRFLRSPAAEGQQILHLLWHYAVTFPEVRFTLLSDGREVLGCGGQSDPAAILARLIGPEMADRLVTVEQADLEGAPLHLRAVLAPPDLARPTRQWLFFAVNRRPVQGRLLALAVEEAYRPYLPDGRHPVGVFHLTVPVDEVDVNVHPAKTEVRLRRERAVFALLQRTVRSALLDLAPLPVVSRVTVVEPPAPAAQPALPLSPVPPAARPASPADSRPASAPTTGRWPALRVLGQVQNTYIVAEGPDGLYVIDQHAAHERVRYEELRAQRARGGLAAQALLEPLVVDLPPEHRAVAEEQATTLAELGFTVEPFGPGSLLVRTVPAGLRSGPAEALGALLQAMALGRPPAEETDPLLATLACHSAVRAGDPLTPEAMIELVERLEGVMHSRYCPHGRPTVLRLSASQLERDFQRR